MTQPPGGGAWQGPNGAESALMSLVKDATVRIHRPEPGYAPEGSDGDFLGSGFFIAPSWVLTCAHVAMEGRGRQVNVVYKTARGGDAVRVGGTVVAALPEERPGTGGWPAPDLALIQLVRPVEHPCVYLSERSTGMNRGAYYFAGWAAGGAGALKRLGRECRVVGTVDDWADGDEQVLIEASQLYAGMSGGPVVDLARGEVVGVLKSRSTDTDGGTAIGVERLRTLPVPVRAATAESDDPYQAVFHAHDRYHADRHNNPVDDEETWADVQRDLGTVAGPALTPQQRVDLLGRLAKLPPPVSTRSLLDILGDLGYGYRTVGVPAPRGWRDGLGVLYDAREGDEALERILRYCMSAISAERPYVVPSTRLAEDALWDWVRETAEDRLRRPFRREMARLRNQGRYAPGTEHLRTPEPADEPVRPPKAPTFVVLHLEPRAWQPDHYDWRVVARLSAVDLPVTENYQGTRSDELPARLGASLGKAFRMCDEPDNPAILQVVVPSALLDLEVEKWQLPADSLPLGVLRPVVVRCADSGPGPSDDADLEHEARWNRLRRGPTRAAVLDCDDEMRVPVPVTAKLRGLPYETVPVLCRYGGRHDTQSVVGFARVLDAGFGVVLWRRPRAERPASCTEFHLRVVDTVDGAVVADRLPRKIQELRKGVREGRPDMFWSDGIALVYGDPQPPPPDPLLQAP
ncbi:serine protease [Streptomyces sp. NBC_00264]|uniref:VMAP-C domain-containing protein n=1 Tax=unclassified Streptomyces TaxID=2593676 RepID=UPI00225AFF6F|nr:MULTISPECIES: trypsin-like peptidase domain-containing protein [unclassified Streptomyces]MCX5162937.1 serine protease [Streptomyces sp. NBC_00305]MCX5221454.1 serine protease [Streptomyces sp. NBC_00264]